MNQQLFYFFYDFAGRSAWGDWLIVFFGEYFIYIVLAIFAVCALWQWRQVGIKRLYSYGVVLIGALIARYGVAEVIRHFYHHLRPFVALNIPHLLSDTSYSFPSGHTIFLFALGAGAHFFNKRLAYFIYLSGLVVGAARIMGGVHYPYDIAGGIILGFITGVAVYGICKAAFPSLS